ncbi:MAG: molybdopterin-dependent oxidoreductase [Planctomycetota bacterium]
MTTPREQPRIDRRDALRALSLTGLGAGLLAGCEASEDPFALTKPSVPGADGWTRGEERWVSTACGQCPAGCGVRVRVVEGRAIKIEGNPECAVNRGGIGPRGLSGPQVLYDPDRIRQPLRRVGARGEPRFEPISWDDALALVSERLRGLREKNEGHRAAIVCGRERGLMLELWQRFAAAYGTPNLIDGMCTENGPVADAMHWMQGVREIPAHDWNQTRYVVSLGSGILESSCQLVYFARAQGSMRRGAAGSRAKIVHAGVAMTRTAMNADEWIAVRPGTHAAFALGLAHVLVRDELYDQAFVAEHGFGFDAWKDEQGVEHAGFKTALLEYTPERVASICGIPVESIARIALDMHANRPCFALAGSEALLASNGVRAAMAVHALNALLGSIDRPGGLLVQRHAPLTDWPELEPDEIALAALAQERIDGAGGLRFPLASSVLDALPEALLSGAPYGLDSLFLYYANPLFSRPDPARWRKALEQVPFIVSFSPFLDETASEVADLILPDHSYLERWEDAAPAPSIGVAAFGVRQPVVQPLYSTRASGDFVIQLAKAIGEPLEEAFAFADFKDAMKQRVVGIFSARRGSIVEEQGNEFLKRLYRSGYWNDDAYPFESWEETLRTPSGRFEFSSQSMWKEISRVASAAGKTPAELLAAHGLPGDLDRACMPGYDEVSWRGKSEDHPLALILFKPNSYPVGGGANQPWLQELTAWTGRRTYTTEAELHPETAQAAKISDGDRIEVASSVGRIEALARISKRVLPGIVRIPQGGGHTAFGRFARGWGANVMQLVGVAQDSSLSGVPELCGTRVSIKKVQA